VSPHCSYVSVRTETSEPKLTTPFDEVNLNRDRHVTCLLERWD
jgi:hypothetical protein